MGSRIMHLLIADKVADQLDVVTNNNLFLLGGIAPDALIPKTHSHFYKGEVNRFTREVDFIGFYERHQNEAPYEFILGYFTHLVADDLWLKGFYLPWLKNRMNHDPAMYDRYHRDFQLLNGKLLDYYKKAERFKRELHYENVNFQADFFHSEKLKDFLHEIFADIDDNSKSRSEPLDVLSLEQIIGYIESSSLKAILHIRELGLKVDL
ncbi:zinc dependent phospholipase C family protein [Halobacillus salinarum]|uniref:Zinc dependent phospholipase C family protein n=1 Tax=Halobacillus salinarum TaxID=2932257 RepID=A0ABY4EDR1_9BACI|nr:zinc dependent phospholipase C family protein [Halobacillus salinarum]UOQ42585.1 zinc dependent phospholipase C family protein [Halobacillus salinarum]